MSELKPILTDETGMRIAEALESSVAVGREMSNYLLSQTEILESMKSGSDIFLLRASFDGTQYTTITAKQDVLAALNENKRIVLAIALQDGYYFSLNTSKKFSADGSVEGLLFAAGAISTAGTISTYTYSVDNGKLFAPSPIASLPDEAREFFVEFGTDNGSNLKHLKFADEVLKCKQIDDVLGG